MNKIKTLAVLTIIPFLASCKAFHTHSYEVISVEVQSTPENPNIGIRTLKCMASYCGDTKREENCSIHDTAFVGGYGGRSGFEEIIEISMNLCSAKNSYKTAANERNIFVYDSYKSESLSSKYSKFKLIVRSITGTTDCSKQFSQVKMFDKDNKYTDSSWEQYWTLGKAFLSNEEYPIERLGEPFYFDLTNGADGLDYSSLAVGLMFFE